jgi:hypothetical protein
MRHARVFVFPSLTENDIQQSPADQSKRAAGAQKALRHALGHLFVRSALPVVVAEPRLVLAPELGVAFRDPSPGSRAVARHLITARPRTAAAAPAASPAAAGASAPVTAIRVMTTGPCGG